MCAQHFTENEFRSVLEMRHGAGLQEKFYKGRVAVAGLGGLGSNIAVLLARAGVGSLHLIDYDVVELSNLNRQQYFIQHVGMFKTSAITEIIKQINPYIRLTVSTEKVTRENAAELFRDDHIICEAFDRAEEKAMLTEAVLTCPDRHILVGASGLAGYDSGNTITTKRITSDFYLCGDGVSESCNGNGLMAPRAALCAAHQANTVLRLLAGHEEP